jgi:hypothetical protein
LAFKKYEEACDNFSRAVEALLVLPLSPPTAHHTTSSNKILEIIKFHFYNRTEIYGELEPQVGDSLMLYGTALLKNAIASSQVLGEGGQKQQEESGKPNPPPSIIPSI